MADNDYGLFWNSVNGDRKYDADSFEIWAKKFFTTGVFNGDLQVTADGGMNVRIGTGYACVEGKVKFFDTSTTQTIMSPSGVYPRIDTIVVERDDINRWIVTKYVPGALSGYSPVATPPVRENGIYQLVLAEIYVAANATQITQANITDKRSDRSVCGWVVGTVTEVDVAQMTAQAQDDFNTWYDHMKDQLTEDAAGHLQTEIDTLDAEKADENAPTLRFPIGDNTDPTAYPRVELRRMGNSPTNVFGMAVYDADGNGTYNNLISADGSRYFATVPELDLKAPLASPTLTGTPKAPTAAKATNTTQIATTAYVKTNLADYAKLASPALTGNPTATTQAKGNNSTRLATTAYVQKELAPIKIYDSNGLYITKTGHVIEARFNNVSSLPAYSAITAAAGGESWAPTQGGYDFVWEYSSKTVAVLQVLTTGEMKITNLNNQTLTTYRLYGRLLWVTD